MTKVPAYHTNSIEEPPSIGKSITTTTTALRVRKFKRNIGKLEGEASRAAKSALSSANASSP
jgi:hypothetical protein